MLGAGLGLLFALPSPAIAITTSVAMGGLDQPRGLTIAPDGSLLVAEAGTGGNSPCYEGPTGPTSFGSTGGISRLRKGVQERILSGLPSAIDGNGFVIAGPVDVLASGKADLEVAIGLADEPSARADCGAAAKLFGTLVHFTPNRKQKQVVDVAAYEAAANPDGGEVESNIYGLLARPDGVIATDAAGHSLLGIASDGTITTLGSFPSHASGQTIDSVPTSVAFGPDGAYYVGDFSGIPYPAGAANVYRLSQGGQPTVFLSGFTAVIDIAFGPDGALYVLQFASESGLSGPGALIRVAPDGSRTTVLSEGLITPTSVVVASDGTIYISNCGVFPGSGTVPCHGHVVKIAPS
jgi:hypothetical protein